jgi:hypothetical protein
MTYAEHVTLIILVGAVVASVWLGFLRRVFDYFPQSSSASRFTAGAFGFLTLSQCGERPER